MTFFKRIKDLISANINDLLTKAEDPEKMLNLVITQMEQAIVDYRNNATNTIALRKRLEKKVVVTRKEVSEWQQNAELAVTNDDDELALKALERKNEFSEKLEAIQTELSVTSAQAESLKKDLRMLEDKIQDARSKRDTLITKRRALETRRRLEKKGNTLHKTLSKLEDINNFFEDTSIFKEIDSELATTNSRLEAINELNSDNLKSQFEDIKKKAKLTRELKELKMSFSK